MSKKYMIYNVIDENNQIFYVGKTCNFDRRYREHLYEIKEGSNLPKHNKMRKLLNEGNDLREFFNIIETDLDFHTANEREVYYIKKYSDKGYDIKNLTDGGDGSIDSIPYIKQRLSEVHLGAKRSEETRRKISEAKKGKKFTEEHRRNLTIARRSRVITDEQRKNMSKAAKGNINTKQYELIDPDGNVHRTKNGLSCFCEENGLSPSNFMKVLSGKRKHHKGWKIRKLN